jgi:predicted secreted protein
MSTEKAPLTAKQRQAKRREEMAAKGYKNLSLGFVHTKYHNALKKLAAQIDEGGITDDLKIKTIVDTSESEMLKKRITELMSELKAVKSQAGGLQSYILAFFLEVVIFFGRKIWRCSMVL